LGSLVADEQSGDAGGEARTICRIVDAAEPVSAST
jgi:hypothetical protein